MILLDVSHTAHTTASTGIQRVCRMLYRELVLTGRAEAVVFDRYGRYWRHPDRLELSLLLHTHGTGRAPSLKSHWTNWQRWRGKWMRWFVHTPRLNLPRYEGMLVPEIFSDRVFPHYASLRPFLIGPMVAVFHDLIAVSHPAFSDSGTASRFPDYLRELSTFDTVAAVSVYSRNALKEWWEENAVANTPPLTTVSLGTERPTPPRSSQQIDARPMLLTVGTLEPRKNHLALWDAAEIAWKEGIDFTLHVVGYIHPETGAAIARRMESLIQAGYPLVYHGVAGDAALHTLYDRCWFTVIPSLIEGFGIPVWESLIHHKPCLCGRGGSLREVAEGGGCLLLKSVDAPALATGIKKLVTNHEFRTKLTNEAAARELRTWGEYADDLLRITSSGTKHEHVTHP